MADMGLETTVPAGDEREIEIVVKHFPFVQGDISPTRGMVPWSFPLTTAREARPRAAVEDGDALRAAEADKAWSYPEVVQSTRCPLVVLAGEVSGRWSAETVRFIAALAKHRSKNAPKRLRTSTQLARETRWWGMLAVPAQDSLAATLVDDAPHLRHGWKGIASSLGELLHAEAPTPSRFPLR